MGVSLLPEGTEMGRSESLQCRIDEPFYELVDKLGLSMVLAQDIPHKEVLYQKLLLGISEEFNR